MVKWLFYIFLVLFLFCRYSPLGLFLGKLVDRDIGTLMEMANKSQGKEFIVFPILVLFSSCLYFILFHFQKLQGYLSKFMIFAKNKTILIITFLYLVLLFGSWNYSLYNDEWRDFTVFKSIRKYGFDVYLNGDNIADEAKEGNLIWVRRVHLPLHYLFVTLSSSYLKLPHDIRYYRLLLVSFYCVWLLALMLFCKNLAVSDDFIIFLPTLTFSFTALRDYSIIRCGTDFFPFIGFTTFMLFTWLIYKQYIKFSFLSLFTLYVSLFLAIMSKVSAILAVLSLIWSLIIIHILSKVSSFTKVGVIDNEEKFFSKILIVCWYSLILTILIYVLLFHNTSVFMLHLKTYLGPLFKILPLSKKFNNLYFESSYVGPVYTIGNFFARLIFQYSPILIVGIIYSLCKLAKEFKLTRQIRSFDLLIFLWVLFTVSGILFFLPDARYSSTIAFGLFFLIFRGFEFTNNSYLPKMYISLSLLFTTTEVILKSIIQS